MAALPLEYITKMKADADYQLVVRVEAILPPQEEPEDRLARCRMQARVLETLRTKDPLPSGQIIEIEIDCWPHGKKSEIPGPQRVHYGGPLPEAPVEMWLDHREGDFQALVWNTLPVPEPPDPAPTMAPQSQGGPAPPSPGAGSVVRRDDLNQNYRDLLPRRGVFAGGGGLLSPTWRVVIDFDAAMLAAARDAVGKLVFGPLAETIERPLTASELSEIEAQALEVLANDRTPQSVFTVDSMGVLFIVDGERAYELMPAGPITEGPAANLQSLLYERAWPDK